MKKYLGILIFMFLAIMIVTGCNKQEETEGEDAGTTEDITVKAEEFIQLLSEGKYEEATENFSEEMNDALPPAGLEEIWDTLNDQVGKFIDQEYKSTEESDGYQIVLIDGLFEGTDVVFSVTFNNDEQIEGFHLQ